MRIVVVLRLSRNASLYRKRPRVRMSCMPVVRVKHLRGHLSTQCKLSILKVNITFRPLSPRFERPFLLQGDRKRTLPGGRPAFVWSIQRNLRSGMPFDYAAEAG